MSLIQDLIGDLFGGQGAQFSGATPAKPANPAKTQHLRGLPGQSATCEGLRIAAKAAADSQVFAAVRKVENTAPAQQTCGVSQDSQVSQPAGRAIAINAWSAADIDKFEARRMRLRAWGWSEVDAERVADRLTRRETDDRRKSCTECASFKAAGRCSTFKAAGLRHPEIGREMAGLLQHCPGFVEGEQ